MTTYGPAPGARSRTEALAAWRRETYGGPDRTLEGALNGLQCAIHGLAEAPEGPAPLAQLAYDTAIDNAILAWKETR